MLGTGAALVAGRVTPFAVPAAPDAWQAPDATQTIIGRGNRLAKIRTGKPAEVAERWAALKTYYREHPADFINDWGMTVDPRLADQGLPVVLPFTLWPKQREYVDWLLARWRSREDGVTEKSRDAGASYLCVGFAVWMWLYYPGAIVGFGSRKEEYVDDSSDPKSLFWKVRSFISYLPVELRPVGYDPRRHSVYMKIENPEAGGMIVGEAGDNIGRGARTSIYFIDEAAFLQNPGAIDAALSQTSNCRIHVSTPNGPAGPFYVKRHSGRFPVFVFDWRDDPRKAPHIRTFGPNADLSWYENEKRRLDPVVLAQEVDRDYNASTTNSYIRGDLIAAAESIGPADVEVMGACIVGVDAAHFGDDSSVVQGRIGRLTLPSIKRSKQDGPTLAGTVIEYCDRVEASGHVVAAIVIELDGPGVSCYDQLRLHPRYGWRVVGLHTGTRLDNGKHYNIKAQLWDNAREYLSVPPVSIPPRDAEGRQTELRSQIGNYRYGYRDGVLLMEAKKDYKKRALKSPDDADSWILTHIGGELIPQRPVSVAIPSTVSSFPRTRRG